jgi:galactonate dehydratase
MKISKLECLPVHAGWRKNFVFVRVETDSGMVGWGEAYSQYDRDRAIAAQVEELGRYVVGRDPFHIRHIAQVAFDDYAQRSGSLELYCATSGIEQALWDIIGKASRQPVYNLLGGPVRSRIRVYANGWSYKMSEPEDYARGAEAVLARGFTAMKFDPVPGPWRTYIPKEHIRRAVKVMRAMRDAVGPDIDLLLDIHRRLAPMHAIDLAHALAEFEPYWFEEPCQAENIVALAEVRRASRIPVVTGEALHTRADFRPVFRARAVDIINPDVSNCGGILEFMYIAAAAEAESIAVSPHNLQFDDALAVGHRACGGLHAQFHHHRILPAVRGDRPAPVSEPAQAGQWIHRAAGRPRARPRSRRGNRASNQRQAIPGAYVPVDRRRRAVV